MLVDRRRCYFAIIENRLDLTGAVPLNAEPEDFTHDFRCFLVDDPMILVRQIMLVPVERTVQYVRDNFMVGIQYDSLNDLNGQAIAWCNKVNGKAHATTGEIPFERIKKEGLSPLKREYIIDKINLRRVYKDCLISYAGNQYSVPAEYVGKDVAVIGLDNMLAAYHDGKQIALHRISYQKRDMVVNAQHYRRMTVKQSFDIENVLLDSGKIIDFPIKPHNLSCYDEVLYE